ncbi:MAG: sigma-54-dependent transcriptional regulator [Candidatus Zhuqueibacterota bacterium]
MGLKRHRQRSKGLHAGEEVEDSVTHEGICQLSRNQTKILVVDDEPEIVTLLEGIISKRGFSVSTATNGEMALKKLHRENYHIILTDLKMPKLDGIELLTRIKENSPETEVIVFTGHGSIETAVDALKKGAYDYIIKPMAMEEVMLMVERLHTVKVLKDQNRYLQNQLSHDYNFDHIIGNNRRMQDVFDIIREVAGTHSTVLIRGESGTGKELIARAIHYNSTRKAQPMISVNCAVLAESLLESELFGHEKGAFTGAIKCKEGRFELANNGTLFLDEIGDISPKLQVKLLRALQEGEFERVGGEKTLKMDVRVIAATNRDLEQAIENNEFRQDLYYRLNVIPLVIPPLRERVDDIPLLADFFLNKYKIQTGKNVQGITKEALEILIHYTWPGNVRELENVIERGVVLCKGGFIGADSLSYLVSNSRLETPLKMLDDRSLPEVMDTVEKQLIETVLGQCRKNKSEASRKLGVHRSTLLSKMEKYGIQ